MVTLAKLISNQEKYLQAAKAGALFIYPTDTIYGIGAIVTPEIVKKIDAAKQRLPGKHYSIIAPSFERIQEYFDVKDTFENERSAYQEQFPGRGLTILLPRKDKTFPSPWGEARWGVLSPTQTIGVRILDHPFQDFITALGQPFITTSCNISGDQAITTIQDIPDILKNHVDYVIDGGELNGKPSVVIDYVSEKIVRK